MKKNTKVTAVATEKKEEKKPAAKKTDEKKAAPAKAKFLTHTEYDRKDLYGPTKRNLQVVEDATDKKISQIEKEGGTIFHLTAHYCINQSKLKAGQKSKRFAIVKIYYNYDGKLAKLWTLTLKREKEKVTSLEVLTTTDKIRDIG